MQMARAKMTDGISSRTQVRGQAGEGSLGREPNGLSVKRRGREESHRRREGWVERKRTRSGRHLCLGPSSLRGRQGRCAALLAASVAPSLSTAGGRGGAGEGEERGPAPLPPAIPKQWGPLGVRAGGASAGSYERADRESLQAFSAAVGSAEARQWQQQQEEKERGRRQQQWQRRLERRLSRRLHALGLIPPRAWGEAQAHARVGGEGRGEGSLTCGGSASGNGSASGRGRRGSMPGVILGGHGQAATPRRTQREAEKMGWTPSSSGSMPTRTPANASSSAIALPSKKRPGVHTHEDWGRGSGSDVIIEEEGEGIEEEGEDEYEEDRSEEEKLPDSSAASGSCTFDMEAQEVSLSLSEPVRKTMRESEEGEAISERIPPQAGAQEHQLCAPRRSASSLPSRAPLSAGHYPLTPPNSLAMSRSSGEPYTQAGARHRHGAAFPSPSPSPHPSAPRSSWLRLVHKSRGALFAAEALSLCVLQASRHGRSRHRGDRGGGDGGRPVQATATGGAAADGATADDGGGGGGSGAAAAGGWAAAAAGGEGEEPQADGNERIAATAARGIAAHAGKAHVASELVSELHSRHAEGQIGLANCFSRCQRLVALLAVL